MVLLDLSLWGFWDLGFWVWRFWLWTLGLRLRGLGSGVSRIGVWASKVWFQLAVSKRPRIV